MKNYSKLFDLSGKIALVTGGAGHLGQEISIGLTEAGAKVYINGRNKEKVDVLVDKIRKDGGVCEPAIFDISNEKEIEKFFKNFSDDKLDIIVNNAYHGSGGTVESSTDKQFSESYEVGLLSIQRILKESLPLVRKGVKAGGYSSIINIASMYGIVSPDLRVYESAEKSNPPFYGVVKAGVLQWTKYAACEFAKEGIRVNALSPGPIPSQNVVDNDPQFIEKLANKVPMGRIGKAQEIVGSVIFLASNASSFITGENIKIDGGWTAW